MTYPSPSFVHRSRPTLSKYSSVVVRLPEPFWDSGTIGGVVVLFLTVSVPVQNR